MMPLPKPFRSYARPLVIALMLVAQYVTPAFSPMVQAQTVAAPRPDAGPLMSAPELQSLVAPIALYPDALLSQMLMASTYPLEVAAATIWLRNNQLTGAAFDAALGQQRWDNSVKSLVHFPDALNLLGNRLDWTHQLGDTYLAQPAELMQSIQALRAQAQQAGYLKSGNQMRVSTDSQSNIIIVPANPEVVYVPTYNPTVVYGPWLYPAYPPYAVYNPAWGAIAFGVGFGVGYALWATPYWGRGGFYINNGYYNRFNYRYNAAPYRYPAQVGPRSAWAFNPAHRYNVPPASHPGQQRLNASPGQARNVNQARQAAQNYWHQNTPSHPAPQASANAPRAVPAAPGAGRPNGGRQTGPPGQSGQSAQSSHSGQSGHSGRSGH